MDIQTASSVGAMLASPTVSNVALAAIPVLFTALMWTFRQQHRKLGEQYRDSLDLIAEQNKQVIDLKSTVANLEESNQRNRDRIVDLKEQIDRLFQELEKTRDEISVHHRFGGQGGYDDYMSPVSAAQNEGISDLLRSLEEKQQTASSAEAESPSMTQIRKQAEFYAQHAESAFNQAQQARRPAPAARPDMTQSIFMPQRETDTQFDLQDYL